MKIWIFGDSLSLPFNLKNEKDGWPSIVATKLNAPVENLAQPAADNFLIYHLYKSNAHKIQPNDIVIIGWSHYSRKTFILDRNNPEHLRDINRSLVYNSGNDELFRSNNDTPDDANKWKTFSPLKVNDKLFFDNWFRNYYSATEQKINLEAYHYAVKTTSPKKYIPFFFSEENIAGTSINTELFILEFILKNNVALTDTDTHPNESGHSLWADIILREINNYDSFE